MLSFGTTKKATIHGLVGIGLIGLLAKLHVWDEAAMFFDGTSLGAEYLLPSYFALFSLRSASYVFAIAVYVTVIIPSLRTIVTPVVGVDTREDQIEAMRILAAGNLIIVLLLGGILVLQVWEILPFHDNGF